MSEAARRDFSPLVIGTSAEPGPIAATFPGTAAKRPNLVALAAIAFMSELLAVAGALWVSLAVCEALVPEFQAPQFWFGLLVSALMVASIAELGQLDDLLDLVRRGKVDVVIVALPWSEGTKIREIIGSVEGIAVEVLLTPDLGAFEPLASSTVERGSVPLLRAIYPPLLGWKAFVKRTDKGKRLGEK